MGRSLSASIVYGVELWSESSYGEAQFKQRFFDMFKSANNPDPECLYDIYEELMHLGLAPYASGYEYNIKMLIVAGFEIKTRGAPKIIHGLSVDMLDQDGVKNLNKILVDLGMSTDKAGFMLATSYSP